MSIFGYRKRVFLASISTGHTSYILTEVESSRRGEYKWGHCMLTMADCRRRIQLEFFLGTLRARRESLRKIDLLIEHLEQYRTALRTEADLIEQYEAKQRPKKQKSNKASKRRAVSNGRTKQERPIGGSLKNLCPHFQRQCGEGARGVPGSADCYRFKDDPGR